VGEGSVEKSAFSENVTLCLNGKLHSPRKGPTPSGGEADPSKMSSMVNGIFAQLYPGKWRRGSSRIKKCGSNV